MDMEIPFGRRSVTLATQDDRVITTQRSAQKQVADENDEPFRHALREPLRFPALHLALTPDDHIAVAVGPGLAEGDDFVGPLVSELKAAGVAQSHCSVVLPPTIPSDAETMFAGLAAERHDPADRARQSYLASTKDGRRVYLNRTVVEADQAVVVGEVRYDANGDPTGGPRLLFPALSDTATRDELAREPANVVTEVAGEVAWLLGAPFFLHVIRGPGGAVARVIGGMADTYTEATAALAGLWDVRVRRPADIVIATITGDPDRVTVGDFAAALTQAGRAASPGATIALLTGTAPAFGDAFDAVREANSAADALTRLRGQPAADADAARLWLRAVRDFRVLVLSGWSGSIVEDLFATPLDDAKQVQRVIDAGGDCVILPDAHRSRVILAKT